MLVCIIRSSYHNVHTEGNELAFAERGTQTRRAIAFTLHLQHVAAHSKRNFGSTASAPEAACEFSVASRRHKKQYPGYSPGFFLPAYLLHKLICVTAIDNLPSVLLLLC